MADRWRDMLRYRLGEISTRMSTFQEANKMLRLKHISNFGDKLINKTHILCPLRKWFCA